MDLERDEQLLNSAFLRTNSLKRKYDINIDRVRLNMAKNTVYNSDEPISAFYGRTDFNEYFYRKLNTYNKKFVIDFEINKKDIFETAKNILSIYEEEQYYEFKVGTEKTHFTEKEAVEIIDSFFNQLGDAEYKVISSFLKEDNYLFAEDKNFKSLCYPNYFLETNYILHRMGVNNIRDITSLIHELGHVLEYKMFLFPQNKNLPLNSDLFLEVYSMYISRLFSKFLKDNRICIKEVDLIENGFLNVYKGHSNALNIIEKTRMFLYSYGGYIKIIDNYDEAIDGKYIYLSEHLMYTFGFLISEYFYNIFLEDPATAKKSINDFISLRGIVDNFDMFDYSNIDKDYICSGEAVRSFVKSNMNLLNERYNISS